MIRIWITEFNWHRLRKLSTAPAAWRKIHGRGVDYNGRGEGRLMVAIDVDAGVLGRLEKLHRDPNTAITMMLNAGRGN